MRIKWLNLEVNEGHSSAAANWLTVNDHISSLNMPSRSTGKGGYWDYWRNLFCRVVLARGRGFRAMDIVDALNSKEQSYNLEKASQPTRKRYGQPNM